MANFYTDTSFILPLTEAEAKSVETAFNMINDHHFEVMFNDIWDSDERVSDFLLGVEKENGADVAKIMADHLNKCDDKSFVSTDGSVQMIEEGLLFTTEDQILHIENTANFVQTVLAHFNKEQAVGFEVAFTQSGDEVGGFGGCAAFITKDDVEFMSTSSWILQKEYEFDKKGR